MLATLAGASMVIQKIVDGGSSCESGSYCTAEYCVYDADGSIQSLGVDAYGQSFQVPATNGIYSIEVEAGFANNASITVRIGTSTNLNTFIVEGTASGIGSGWTEIVVSTHPELSSGVTYYIGIIETSGDFRWAYEASEYTHGSDYGTDSVWQLGNAGARCYSFRIKLCD